MIKKRRVSILVVVLAMGGALVATPTLADRSQSVSHQTYRTPAPTAGAVTVLPSYSGGQTGGGRTPRAGSQGVVSGAGSPGNPTNPSALPVSGGAAR